MCQDIAVATPTTRARSTHHRPFSRREAPKSARARQQSVSTCDSSTRRPKQHADGGAQAEEGKKMVVQTKIDLTLSERKKRPEPEPVKPAEAKPVVSKPKVEDPLPLDSDEREIEPVCIPSRCFPDRLPNWEGCPAQRRCPRTGVLWLDSVS